MTTPATTAITMTGEEFALYVGRMQTRVLGILVVVLIVGAVAGFRNGYGGRELTLVVGAIASGLATVAFGKQLMIEAADPRRRSIGAAGRAAAAIVPLLLAFYLTLYEGFWQFGSVWRNFSFFGLLARLMFIYLGYRLATWLMQLSEVPNQLSRGALRVSDSPA